MSCLEKQIPTSFTESPFISLFSVSCLHHPIFPREALTGIGTSASISALDPLVHFHTAVGRESVGIDGVNPERLQGGKKNCVEWEISQQRPDKVLPTHAVLSGCTASSASEVITQIFCLVLAKTQHSTPALLVAQCFRAPAAWGWKMFTQFLLRILNHNKRYG